LNPRVAFFIVKAGAFTDLRLRHFFKLN